MKLLAFGDLHNARNLDKIEAVIASEKPDKTIFCGDYFDAWGDDMFDVLPTAKWLEANAKDPKRVYLMGNHDAPYWCPTCPWLYCSGNTDRKLRMINTVLSPSTWDLVRLYHFEGTILFTHAGLSRRLLMDIGGDFSNLPQWLEKAAAACLKAINEHSITPLMDCGYTRMGSNPCGGITWCDQGEFLPIVGYQQVFGHTPQKLCKEFYRQIEPNNWCIDTNGGRGEGPRQYLKIEDNVYTVHDLPRP